MNALEQVGSDTHACLQVNNQLEQPKVLPFKHASSDNPKAQAWSLCVHIYVEIVANGPMWSESLLVDQVRLSCAPPCNISHNKRTTCRNRPGKEKWFVKDTILSYGLSESITMRGGTLPSPCCWYACILYGSIISWLFSAVVAARKTAMQLAEIDVAWLAIVQAGIIVSISDPGEYAIP